MRDLNHIGPLAGRILIALIFVWSGFNKITDFEGTVGYIAGTGLPLSMLGAIASTVVELGGGLMLIVGYKVRWAAGVMLIFTGAAAVFFHNFWAVPPNQAQNTLIHFMKNVSMMGGLLYVVVHGAGPISLDDKVTAISADVSSRQPLQCRSADCQESDDG